MKKRCKYNHATGPRDSRGLCIECAYPCSKPVWPKPSKKRVSRDTERLDWLCTRQCTILQRPGGSWYFESCEKGRRSPLEWFQDQDLRVVLDAAMKSKKDAGRGKR